MKKQFLLRANVLLGTLSLMLAGCHSTKKAAEASATPEPADEPKAQAVKDAQVICMYGVPPQIYEQQRQKEEEEARKMEQQRQDSLQNDSVGYNPDRVMLKYGVPYPRPTKER